jgi:hypothetical protein
MQDARQPRARGVTPRYAQGGSRWSLSVIFSPYPLRGCSLKPGTAAWAGSGRGIGWHREWPAGGDGWLRVVPPRAQAAGCRVFVDDRDRWAALLAEATADTNTQCQRICQLCVDLLEVSGGGISMVTSTGNRGVVCATDDVSAQIEALQFSLGEGPCVDAVTSGVPVLIPDLRQHGDVAVERWPAFMEAASAAGVQAVFALPLRIGAINVGAMDLYRDRAGDLEADHLSAALMAADAAAIALLHLASTADSTFSDDLDTRSAYQLQVHQATGMVQVQLGVRTEDAFLMLRARAFALGRPLLDVAIDVVERRLRFTPEDQ